MMIRFLENSIFKQTRRLACIAVLLACIFTILPGCNKQLNVKSTHLASEADGWDSYDDVGSALTGLYGLLRAAMAEQNTYWLFGDLRNGDFTAVSRQDLSAIISGKLNVTYPVIQDILDWRRFYAVINACNLFIERSPEALQDERYTELNNKVDIAQARAIRAYVYFYISRIWGDVPLITTSHDGVFEDIPRTSQDKVLAFASTELLAAAKVLPFEYGVSNDPIFPGNYYGYDYTKYYNTLFNRVFAYCVLAHIAAWQGRYNDVNAYCQFVLDNYNKIGAGFITDVTELTNSNGFFLDRTDTKQIFSLYEATGYNESGISGIGHIESLTLAQPLVSKEKPDMYVTKDSIGSIFTDLKDTRFGIDTTATKTSSSSSDVLAGGSSTGNTQYTSNYFTNYNGDLPIFSKIKVIGDGSTTTNLDVFGSSIVLDRLEEIVLLDAEAMAVLNQNENAISLLNQVKANRGVSLYSGEGGNPLIKEIFQERRRELMGEGWRWFDLVRYNKIVRDNPAFNKLIDEGGIYWPVAQTTLSGEITQNTYWQ